MGKDDAALFLHHHYKIASQSPHPQYSDDLTMPTTRVASLFRPVCVLRDIGGLRHLAQFLPYLTNSHELVCSGIQTDLQAVLLPEVVKNPRMRTYDGYPNYPE